jgi:ribose/xylose/arabinose/galactoside ABC-type transport system permease subunit
VQRLGAVWLVVLILYAVSGLFSPGMFQVGQVLNILQVAAFLGVVATGQTLALLTGGIDLSVAGMVTMANIVSTSVMAGRDGVDPVPPPRITRSYSSAFSFPGNWAEEAFSIPLYAGFCFLWSEYALADSGESDALATSCLSK